MYLVVATQSACLIAMALANLSQSLGWTARDSAGRKPRSSGRAVGMAFLSGVAYGAVAIAFFERLSS